MHAICLLKYENLWLKIKVKTFSSKNGRRRWEKEKNPFFDVFVLSGDTK